LSIQVVESGEWSVSESLSINDFAYAALVHLEFRRDVVLRPPTTQDERLEF
jgi:hypothetical protein